MSDAMVTKAALRSPPRIGADLTGEETITAVRSKKTTPADWINQWVRFRAVGTDVTIAMGAEAAIDTITVMSGAAPGFRIPDGQAEEFYITSPDLFLGMIGAGNGTLQWTVVSRDELF